MQTSTASLLPVAEQVVVDRRHLHAHPELGFCEVETAGFVAERLRALGLEVQTGVARTGVVALIRGARPGRTVLLRADMDALPIQEENDVPYASRNPGVMHACGHDAHTAILLGAAHVLARRRDLLAGTVKLVFQPCEEQTPGGAVAMIAEGVLENPRVDAAFALHVSQDGPVGTVSTCAGPIMAAADTFTLKLSGAGGHGAYPHQCIDPVVAAAQIVLGLQTIVSREVDPMQSAVITVGGIRAGKAPNIIPQTCTMTGTVRSFDKKVRSYLAKRIEEVATGLARVLRVECVCHYSFGNPVVVNDPAMTELVFDVAREVVAKDKVLVEAPSMGAEDFSSFLEKVPGNFFFLGTRNPARNLIYDHHHSKFDIDEAALPTGVDMMVAIAEHYLGS
jgi:amidohydrolase